MPRNYQISLDLLDSECCVRMHMCIILSADSLVCASRRHAGVVPAGADARARVAAARRQVAPRLPAASAAQGSTLSADAPAFLRKQWGPSSGAPSSPASNEPRIPDDEIDEDLHRIEDKDVQ